METLDDLLSDSDYEGPASKLRLHAYTSVTHGAPDPANGYGLGVASLEPILEPSEVFGSLVTDVLQAESFRGDNIDGFPNDSGGDEEEDPMGYAGSGSGQPYGSFSAYRFHSNTSRDAFSWERNPAPAETHFHGIGSKYDAVTSPCSDGLDEFTELEKQVASLTEAPMHSSKLSKWEWVSEGTPRSSNCEDQDFRSLEVETEAPKDGAHLRASEESFESELCTESALVQKDGSDEHIPTTYSKLGKSGSRGQIASSLDEAVYNSSEEIKTQAQSKFEDNSTPQISSSPLETSTACSSGTVEQSTSVASEPSVATSSGSAPLGKKQFLKKGARMQRSLIPPSNAGDAKASSNKQIPQLKPRSASLPAVSSRPPSQSHSDFHVEVRVPLGPPHRFQASLSDDVRDGIPDAREANCQEDDIDSGYAQLSRTANGTKAQLGRSSSVASGSAYAGGYSSRKASNASYSGGVLSPSFGGLDDYGTDDVVQGAFGALDADDEWADTRPWDCRGADLDLEIELDKAAPGRSNDHPSLDSPPTSKVVQSYFRSTLTPNSSRQGKVMEGQSSRTSQQQGRWEVPDLRRPPSTPELCALTEAERSTNYEQEEKVRLAALESEIKKYEKENEQLKRLRAQVEQSERDIAREREKLRQEVDAEKQALHAEFDAEQAALKRERRRLTQNAERLRQQLADDRDAAEERKQLRERTEQLEEELREKEKRWTRTVDRLQRQVCDFTRKNQELEEEVRRAGLQVQQAQFGLKRSESTTSARGRQPKAAPRSRTPNQRGMTGAAHSSSEPWQEHSKAADDAYSRGGSEFGDFIGEKDGASNTVGQRRPSKTGLERSASKPRTQEAWSSNQDSTVVREIRSGEGRTERFFEDGRREVEFSNGLKKVLFPDGKTRVLFQNGDEKEIRPDGVVVYHYHATKAVQTTLPDGCETYQFQDGQFEKHHPDGSKEIHFPNGTTKRVQADGSEEVSFADGTVRRSASTSHISAH